MSIYQNLFQPPPVKFYGLSQPMVGSMIPGPQINYPVIVKNFPDMSEQVTHRKRAENPVTQFPNMGQDHGKSSGMIEKLKQMLQARGEPSLRKGYERMSEDLSWRSQGHSATPSLPQAQV